MSTAYASGRRAANGRKECCNPALVQFFFIMTSKERHEQRYQRRKAERERKKQEKFALYDDYDQIFTYKNLRKSAEKCFHGVRWKPSVQKYMALKGLRTYRILDRLRERKYKGRKPVEFTLMERGHVRHIKARYIDDRVVQRTLCDYSLVPMLSSGFIYDNSASLKGKGYHFAVRRFREHLLCCIRIYGLIFYILFFDFKSFFESIRHNVINGDLAELYQDADLLLLLKQLIAENGDSFFVANGTRDGPTGLGLGSHISQICALQIVNPIDHAIKNAGIFGYGRYMDDGYIISADKEFLKRCAVALEIHCKKRGIQLNTKKTRIVKSTHCFTYLQKRFQITESGRLIMRISKSSATRERRKLKKLKKKVDQGLLTVQDVYTSYKAWEGYARYGNSWNTIQGMHKLYDNLFPQL